MANAKIPQPSMFMLFLQFMLPSLTAVVGFIVGLNPYLPFSGAILVGLALSLVVFKASFNFLTGRGAKWSFANKLSVFIKYFLPVLVFWYVMAVILPLAGTSLIIWIFISLAGLIATFASTVMVTIEFSK